MKASNSTGDMNLENPRAEPQEALNALMDGNKRFAAGQPVHPHQDAARRSEVLSGQAPLAVIVTCSDSRVPPEVFFDQGIGDIFVIRTAGNVLDDIALGSVEYAAEHLKTPLVLVVGHQKCGAVSAVVSGGELAGHLVDIGAEIKPAVEEARTMDGDLLANAIDKNILRTVERLKTSEPVLAELVHSGALTIRGARYDLESGEVNLFPE